MLYVLPTPIGHIDDITIRCIRACQELSYMLCEDTRQTKKLLKLLDIDYSDKKMWSLTSFTTPAKIAGYLKILSEHDVGLMSDAGTPGLSDPGKAMIALCHEHDIPFTVFPGANALVPAVIASGFDTSSFIFLGFLPKKKGKQTALQGIITAPRPTFFYESVHRVHKTLQQLHDLGFTGKISIARELTKMHEQFLTAPIQDVLAMFAEGVIVSKGEFVVGCYPVAQSSGIPTSYCSPS